MLRIIAEAMLLAAGQYHFRDHGRPSPDKVDRRGASAAMVRPERRPELPTPLRSGQF